MPTWLLFTSEQEPDFILPVQRSVFLFLKKIHKGKGRLGEVLMLET